MCVCIYIYIYMCIHILTNYLLPHRCIHEAAFEAWRLHVRGRVRGTELEAQARSPKQSRNI